jgi:hypothetical protein
MAISKLTAMKKYQKLKEILIQIQKENKSGKAKILNEIQEYRNSDDYKIKLEDIAKEILEAYDQSYYQDKEQQIRNEIGVPNKGGWKRYRGEAMFEYEDRIQKADYRLSDLISYIKDEVGEAWSELSQIEAIKNLTPEAKKEILKTLISKLNTIAGEMLKTLSVYPFEWDFDVSNISNNVDKL